MPQLTTMWGITADGAAVFERSLSESLTAGEPSAHGVGDWHLVTLLGCTYGSAGRLFPASASQHSLPAP